MEQRLSVITLGVADLLAGRFVVLRRGKKTYSLIDVAD